MTDKLNELQEIVESLNLDKEIFTEDVMSKIKLVVESKVNEQLEEQKQALEEENKKELSEFKENLIDQLDEYMNYFVEEFTAENKNDIIDSVKVKTAERVLENFNKMVNEFNMSLSEDTLDQSEDVDKLTESLNKTVNENIKLKKEINEANKYALILDNVMKIGTDSTKSKFSKLAESFTYEDDDSFTEKLNTLRESLTEDTSHEEENVLEESETVNSNKTLIESSTTTDTKKRYLNVLYRTA